MKAVFRNAGAPLPTGSTQATTPEPAPRAAVGRGALLGPRDLGNHGVREQETEQESEHRPEANERSPLRRPPLEQLAVARDPKERRDQPCQEDEYAQSR